MHFCHFVYLAFFFLELNFFSSSFLTWVNRTSFPDSSDSIKRQYSFVNGQHVLAPFHTFIYIAMINRECSSLSLSLYIYIYIIIIIIMSCRQHGYPWPSLATSPNCSSLLAGLLGYIPYPHIAPVCIRAGRLAFARAYVGVHWSTSLMSSSLLLQQCSACLVRLTWIVFVMGGWWPYSWCFVRCCLQDLFNIALSILV